MKGRGAMRQEAKVRRKNSEDDDNRTVESTRKAAKPFQDLPVWQKAHQFVLGVYKLTKEFPKLEFYGLIAQLRRSAVSIPANVAEGFKRRGKADKVRFMNMAQSSLEEARYYLILARDLDYADPSQSMAQIEEVSKMLEAYSRSILASGF
jgi:four helix bundle protein